MAAEDYIDIYDYCDDEYWINFYEPPRKPKYTDKFKFNNRSLRTDRQKLMLEGAIVFNKKAIEDNKFYIGSPSVIQRKWGHPTEVEAVNHAQQMLAEDREKGEVFIVEIIKIVRRKPIDVDIEEV